MDDHILRMLAESDEFDKVKRFDEIFMEYHAVTPEMITTGIPTTIPLIKDKKKWKENENLILRRMSNSLAGFLLNIRKRPNIRYLSGS